MVATQRKQKSLATTRWENVCLGKINASAPLAVTDHLGEFNLMSRLVESDCVVDTPVRRKNQDGDAGH